LWVKHPEMDFSFFGEEAVEEVKRFVAQASKDAEASTLQDQSGVVPLAVNVEGQPTDEIAPLC